MCNVKVTYVISALRSQLEKNLLADFDRIICFCFVLHTYGVRLSILMTFIIYGIIISKYEI